MKARAKMPHRTVRAFTGKEYVSYEWREVPDGVWDEAQRLYEADYLELLMEKAAEPEPGGIDATDAAQELAGELGIDLATISGTGAGGRIVVGDVRTHAFAEDEEE